LRSKTAADEEASLGEIGTKVRPGIEQVELWEAARSGKLDLVKELMGKRVDVLASDEEQGETALHMAARGGHAEVIRELVRDRRLEVLMAKNSDGKTARDVAQMCKKKAAMKELAALEREAMEKYAKDMTVMYTGKGAVLTKEEYKDMVHAIMRAKPVDATASERGDKFTSGPKELVCGEFKYAAKGIFSLMNVSEDEINGKLMRGVEAMEEEVERLGDKDVSDLLKYILYEPASEKEYPNGVRDKGRNGMRLADFAKHPNAMEAELNLAEVAALRVYTTAVFMSINNPLRDQERNARKEPHPLPVTTALIVRGIKKLRAIGADDGSGAVERVVLYRGMRNLVAGDDFIKMGGTELAPMSTTTDITTAVSYSMSPESLIFRIVTANKLQRGADLQWVSAFAGEAEVLYAPLTFLQPTGRSQVVELDGKCFTVVEVNVTSG